MLFLSQMLRTFLAPNEADNYIPDNYGSEDFDSDQEIDNFDSFKKRTQNLKDEPRILHQKYDKDSLFYAICYAARYFLTQKKTKQSGTNLKLKVICQTFYIKKCLN